ncbi:Guanine nucleotide exchange factor for Cdc42p [Linderina macrospora]|uniref:Guanine nucleotide exchange factor for Cdc42p n=1 Tax=Linderina macrospora TaxID=4868 RepID=A0ACC1JAN2_9FUNG|nr:Guanine nucleotide exchange factor for Cdc42p [Linderina macrospora]
MYKTFKLIKARFSWFRIDVPPTYFKLPRPQRTFPQPICFEPEIKPPPAQTKPRPAYISPYELTVVLIERLLRLPSISMFLYPILVDEINKGKQPIRDPRDPLRTLFAHGYTLNILLNELESPFVSTINLYEKAEDGSYESYQTWLFWNGCVRAELISDEVLEAFPGFDIADSDEDLERTLRVVAAIVDVLQVRGKLTDVDPRFVRPSTIYPVAAVAKGAPRYAELAMELSRTEVAYVQDLERLKVGLHALVDIDTVFLHIDGLLALHRHLSMAVQYLAAQPLRDQLYGALYENMADFDIYCRYCSNRDASQAAYQEILPQLSQIPDDLDPSFDLPALLLRPIQRLAQYPIMFQGIIDAAYEDSMYMDEPELTEQMQSLPSIYTAIRRSKRTIARANEETRERQNERLCDEFFDRLEHPIPSSLTQTNTGRLLTSGKLSVRVGVEYEEFEAFLFEHYLVLCAQAPKLERAPSRLHRTISNLHMSMRSMRVQVGGRRRSSSSASVMSSECPSSPEPQQPMTPVLRPAPSFLGSKASNYSSLTAFQPLNLEIDTPATTPHSLLSSHASLNTLRGHPMGLNFASSVNVASQEPEKRKVKSKKPGLVVRELVPTMCISQTCLINERHGVSRLTAQIVADGIERMFVIKMANRESESVWMTMLRRAVPLHTLESGSKSGKLYINPRFVEVVLGTCLE